MKKAADEQIYFLRTPALSEVFNVSERQIQRLVEAGVIEAKNENAIPYEFDLRVVVPQYANFLNSKMSTNEWAPRK